MRVTLIGLIFFLSLFLQGSATTFPLIVVLLLFLYIFYRQTWIFFLAFFAGIFLDIFSVRPIGSTSIFLLFFLLSVFLYQRKFEIGSYYFIFFALLLSSYMYSFVFSIDHGMFVSFLAGVVGVVLFFILQRIGKEKQRRYIL